MLVAFTNTKGGTGKSTLAASLVLWLREQGVSVGLLDTDPQETAGRWVKAAESGIPVRTATDADGIQRARRELADEVQVVVADTPGAVTEASQVVPLLADLCIVPLQPSKPDVRALKDALKFIRVSREVHGRPDVFLVFNCTAKRDLQARKLRTQITELGHQLAKSEVRRLNALRDAADTSVMRLQTPDAKEASRDLEQLFLELLGDRLSLPQTLPRAAHG